MTTFLVGFLVIIGVVALSVGAAIFGALAATRDLKLDLERERARTHNAHHTGDLMVAQLAEFLKRKDLGVKTRHHVGDLLLRWGALRPATTDKS